jgi:hypothetical protein
MLTDALLLTYIHQLVSSIYHLLGKILWEPYCRMSKGLAHQHIRHHLLNVELNLIRVMLFCAGTYTCAHEVRFFVARTTMIKNNHLRNIQPADDLAGECIRNTSEGMVSAMVNNASKGLEPRYGLTALNVV